MAALLQTTHAETMLAITGLRVNYGGIKAVKGIDLEIRSGELVTLIGANGAGKTTTLKAVMGLLPPAGGEIHYLGNALAGKPTYKMLRDGLAMVTDEAGIRTDIERMFVTFPRLKERANQLAGTLSGGEQQMLAMARALMGNPKLLLLDEPSMGLSPLMVEKIFDVVREIRSQGMTILLVEQNARLALQLADRGYVMESGLITMTGDATQMLDDPKVRAAYLGE